MAKLGIFLEEDETGELTGRFQVAFGDEVWDTFVTEKAADKAMAKMQAELDWKAKVKSEYLAWERDCLTRHKITRNKLRVFLVNMVCV